MKNDFKWLIFLILAAIVLTFLPTWAAVEPETNANVDKHARTDIASLTTTTNIHIASSTGVHGLNATDTVAGQDFVVSYTTGIVAPGSELYFITETSSDIGGYEQMTSTSPVALTSDTPVTLGTAYTLIDAWISPSGRPNITIIPAGLYPVTQYVTKSNGVDATLLYELWLRTTGGVETLIATSSIHTVTIDAATCTVDPYFTVSVPITATASDRLVLKQYGKRDGTPAVTITNHYGDAVQGFLSFPVSGNLMLRADFSNLTATSAARIALNLSNHHRVTVDSAGNVGFPGVISTASGTATNPSHSFTNDPDTGMYSNGDGVLGFVINGSTKLSISSIISATLSIAGAIAGQPQVTFAQSPSSTTPVFTYKGDTGSGLGRKDIGQPSMVASGTEAQRWTNVWSGIFTRLSVASSTDDGVNALQVYGNVYASGGVGICTTTVPVNGIAVVGGIAVRGNSFPSSGNGLEFSHVAGDAGYVQTYNRSTSAYESLKLRGGVIDLMGNGVFTARATANQNFTIGSTTDDLTNKLQVYGPASISGSIAANGGIIASGLVELNGNGSAVKVFGAASNPSSGIDGRGGIDVWNTTIMVGAQNQTNTRTNSTTKLGHFLVPHYTNAEEPVLGVQVTSTAASNTVVIGGASSFYNAANLILFYTAANNTTVTGVSRAAINGLGQWTIASGSITPATATSCLFRVVGGAEVASMTIGTDTPAAGYQLTVASGAYLTNVLATGTLTIPLVAPADPQPGMIWFEP